MERMQRDGIKCVVFPDDGAKNRFDRIFNPIKDKPDYTIACCTKEHVEDSTEKIGKMEKGAKIDRKKIIIVDDRHTLFKCMDAAIDAGATRVSMFVTHGAFWSLLYARSRH